MRTAWTLTFALVSLAPAHAFAWESKCYRYADPSLSPSAYASISPIGECTPGAGPDVARARWIGPLDEHRQLFDESRRAAGVPDAIAGTLALRVFVDGALDSVRPVPFEVTTASVVRTTSIAELAQLPDFSYGLWDWATGNETCPLDASLDAVSCHEFASHMGPVNANHFPPQSGDFYARGHAMAVARANACHAMADTLGKSEPRFHDYVLDCENEALALEAVAQHYLEDTWSSGHMWQRWGSAELTDFPGASDGERRANAVLVALASGMIHGARGVLQRLPAWTTFDVNDALCAPHPDVRFVLGGTSSIVSGLGDDYYADLGSDFDGQHAQLIACAAAGISEVYRASGERHGAMQPQSPAVVDPTGVECVGQRVTNRAMLEAAGIELRVAGLQFDVPLDARVASLALPVVATSQGEVALTGATRARFRIDLMRAASMARVLSAQNPSGTEAAEGGLGTFMGTQPNAFYANRGGHVSYEDPSLPWPATSDGDGVARDRALALARVFHRAHAADWCTQTTRASLDAMRAHARDATLDAPSHVAACGACVEMAQRHVRVTTTRGWDFSQEPLCRSLVPDAPVIYGHGLTSSDAAHDFCGC
jgi:hypothetical protein